MWEPDDSSHEANDHFQLAESNKVCMGISFNDKVTSNCPGAYETAFFGDDWNDRAEFDETLMMEDEGDQEDVNNLGKGIYEIAFNREEKKDMHRQWKHAFIIKVIGLNPGYRVLLNKLRTLWVRIRGLNLISVERASIYSNLQERQRCNMSLKKDRGLFLDIS